MTLETVPYDSILFVSFGGPEGMDDVIPFLENVLRGKQVPHQRMLEVAEHYRQFGGISPINQQNRQLIDALRRELDQVGIGLPIYWGNRNWHPLLPDTMRQMRDDGCQKAIAFFTSMFSCYSGCRQYRENISDAQQAVGPGAPQVDKVRMGFNHPLFIAAQADLLQHALKAIAPERLAHTRVLFTAHSIPMSMADNSRYESQLREACRLVAEAVGHRAWELVYQSRSGPPQQPWLEPDICDCIEQLAHDRTGALGSDKTSEDDRADRVEEIVIVPIGFVSDHMEVLFDLDTEAAQICRELGLGCTRVPSVGTHPQFVQMIRELLAERILGHQERPACGALGPSHDVCPVDCCLYPRPQRPQHAAPVN